MKLQIATIFLLCLILTTTHASNTVFSDSLVAKLKDSKMGKIIMGMAELAGVYDSEFQILIDSLNELADSLSDQQSNENVAFSLDSDVHDTTVSALSQAIMNAQSDISSTRDNLDLVLYPSKANFEAQIQQNIQDIQADKDAIQVRQVQRDIEKEKYQQVQADLAAAIDACQSALVYLNQLKNPTNSLVQLSAKQQQLQMIETKNQLNSQLKKVISKARFSPIIDALAQMADSQIFTNQEMLNEVISLIENLLGNFQNQVETSTSDEVTAQNEFDTFYAQRQDSIQYTTQIQNQNQVTLNDVNQQILEGEAFFEQRQIDLQDAKDSLARENVNWETKKETHNQLNDEYSNELYIIQQCVNALNSRNQA